MAQTKSTQKTKLPTPAYNFRVTIDGHALGFSEVSGIEVEHETVTYAHGLSFWEGENVKKYTFDKAVPVSFKRGSVRGIEFLHEWLGDEKPRLVEVSLCDEQGQPVVTWRIAKALAMKLQAPTFDVTTNEVAIENLEVMARGITVTHH